MPLSKGKSVEYKQKISVDKALAFLENKTPDGIYEFLKRKDFKGDKCTEKSCPVARFLQERTGLYYLSVKPNYVSLHNNDFYTLPVSVKLFISFFDENYYPELVK